MQGPYAINRYSDVGNTTVAREGRVVLRGVLDFATIRKNMGRAARADAGVVYTQFPKQDEEIFTVQDGDPVVRFKRINFTPSRMSAALQDGGLIPCFGTLNGFSATGIDFQQRRRNLLERLQFVGIADTEQQFSLDGMNGETGFAIQKGGLKTVVNTAEEFIPQFEYLYWDIPNFENVETDRLFFLQGTNTGKCPVILRKVTPEKIASEIRASLSGGLRDALDNGNAMTPAQSVELDAAIHKFYCDRLVGQAMSSAHRGQRIDILLGNYQT